MSEDTHKDEKTIPFFPTHITTEAWVTVGLMVIVLAVGIIGFFTPIGLGEPADPMNTPMHVKAHWYFVFLQEMLKYVPKNIGVVIPVLALFALMLWPFFDRRKDSHRARTFRIVLVVVVMAVIAVLTVMGERS
jgi:quinol-cytochrome oxidoreductase complex cytochrome b subunit